MVAARQCKLVQTGGPHAPFLEGENGRHREFMDFRVASLKRSSWRAAPLRIEAREMGGRSNTAARRGRRESTLGLWCEGV